MRIWNVLGVSVALCAGLVGQASAHDFHYEIDVSSQLAEDAAGNLTGMRMSWLYDKPVTDLLLEGEDLSPANLAATLNTVADRIMTDLYAYRYYAHLKLDGKELPLVKVSSYKLDMTPDKRLKLDFLLPLAAPQVLQGKQLDIEMLEPSGAGVLLYKSPEHVSTGASKANCDIQLEAHPDYADSGAPPQTVHLYCQ